MWGGVVFFLLWEKARESFILTIAAEFGGNFGGELDTDKRHRERWEGSTGISRECDLIGALF